MITDIHVHIEPLEYFTPEARETIRSRRKNLGELEEFIRSPRAFLSHMDEAEVERVALINYVAPEVIGLKPDVNDFVAKYCSADPKRLIACGGIDPRATPDVERELERVLRLGVRMIKIHPPHQLLAANDYLNGIPLDVVYRRCEAEGIPVMVHTGTSVFPGARNKFGDPMHLDDVCIDFPRLTVIMAHGGRPLWHDTAFFLLRRHANLYLDVSGIPPKSLLASFPRIEEIAHKTLFGSDWPGPGVPSIGENLKQFSALPLSEAAKKAALSDNALKLFPA